MQKTNKKLLLAKNDYNTIMFYVKKGLSAITFNRRDAEELERELKNAKLVNSDDLPADVVRLNSTVVIREEKENKGGGKGKVHGKGKK